MERKSRQLLVNGLGSLVFASSQAGIAIVVSRQYGAKGLGEFSYALALCAPLFLFAQMQMRWVVAASPESSSTYSSLRLIRRRLSSVAVVVALTLGCLFSGGALMLAMVACVATSKYIENQQDLIYGECQRTGRFGHLSFSVSARGALGLGAVACAAWNDLSLSYAMGGVAAAWLLVYVGFDSRYETRVVSHLADKMSLSMAVKKHYVLGFATLFGSLMATVPRYAIEAFHGSEQLGTYSTVVYAFMPLQVLVGATLQVFAQPVSRAISETGSLGEVKSVVIKAAALITSLCALAAIAGFALGEMVFSSIFASDAEIDVKYFPIFAAAFLLQYLGQLGAVLLIAARKYKEQATSIGIGAFVVSAVSVVLVPSSFMEGAVLSVGVGSLVYLVVTMMYVRRMMGTKTTKQNEGA